MIVNIGNDRLQLIKELRQAEERLISEGNHTKAYDAGMSARNLAANSVFIEMDRIDEACKRENDYAQEQIDTARTLGEGE